MSVGRILGKRLETSNENKMLLVNQYNTLPHKFVRVFNRKG